MSRNVTVVDDPFTGEVVVERTYLTRPEADERVERARCAQRAWSRTTVPERVALVERFIERLVSHEIEIARDISRQMGKPLAQARSEVRGAASRARTLVSMAEDALATEVLPDGVGLERRISHEPVGVVLAIGAWNYPLLVSVNVVVPAVLAGNAVLVKPSPRTPLCAEHFERAFAEADAPDGLVQAFLADHPTIAETVEHPAIGYVSFTGSTRGGRELYRTVASRRFIDVGLELGGKDPAYISEDADVADAVQRIVQGSFHNAGQSCCAVERLYVHRRHYGEVLERAEALVRAYRMGNPLDEATTLGPMALPSAPDRLGMQVAEAKERGARVIVDGGPASVDGQGRFFSPVLVADADQELSLMRDESFGPVLGLRSVMNDEEALQLMNDSAYGLTASVWTRSDERFERMARRLEAGTVFMNRCDVLDPALAWSGWKDSGKGSSLSRWGFAPLTRRKSWLLRTTPS